MLIDLLQPIHVTAFGKVEKKSGLWHTGRRLPDHLLVIAYRGRCLFQVGDARILLCAGALLFVPAGTFYIPLETDGVGYYFFHFTAAGADTPGKDVTVVQNTALPEGEYAYHFVWKKACLELPTHATGIRIPEVEQMFSRFLSTDYAFDIQQKLQLDSALYQVLLQCCQQEKTHSNRSLDAITDYLDASFAQPLTLSAVAARFGLSAAYVARLFRNYRKCTLSQYVNGVRLRHACELLSSTGLPIQQVALRCGFENPYYFSRIFRKTYHMTATQFRAATRLP